jgi:four helix bundle protein
MIEQILKSGTSISANLSEAIYAVSRKDFLNKAHIALKECSETLNWLELIRASNALTEGQFDSMNKDCEELLKLLISTTKTTKFSEPISNI